MGPVCGVGFCRRRGLGSAHSNQVNDDLAEMSAVKDHLSSTRQRFFFLNNPISCS